MASIEAKYFVHQSWQPSSSSKILKSPDRFRFLLRYFISWFYILHIIYSPILPSLTKLCFFFIFCSVLSLFVGQSCSKPRVMIASPILNSRSVKDSGKDAYWYLIFDVSKPNIWKIYEIYIYFIKFLKLKSFYLYIVAIDINFSFFLRHPSLSSFGGNTYIYGSNLSYEFQQGYNDRNFCNPQPWWLKAADKVLAPAIPTPKISPVYWNLDSFSHLL